MNERSIRLTHFMNGRSRGWVRRSSVTTPGLLEYLYHGSRVVYSSTLTIHSHYILTPGREGGSEDDELVGTRRKVSVIYKRG